MDTNTITLPPSKTAAQAHHQQDVLRQYGSYGLKLLAQERRTGVPAHVLASSKMK